MIIDSLKNSARYEQINPYFKQAFDFLKKEPLSQLATGKTVLQEGKLFLTVNDTRLKNAADAKLEVHNKYIDIQIPVSVSESFGWKSRAACQTVATPYNPEKDIEFYADLPATYFTLQPDEFVIFFPEDGHAPCIGSGDIRKIIVKVICE
jgi:YhcH/YjgK/YiaL family protein